MRLSLSVPSFSVSEFGMAIALGDSALRLLRIAQCQASRFQFSVVHSEEEAAFLH